MDRQALLSDLQRDEGLRLQVYDDTTGKAVRPGYTLKGHPTIGIGRALDVHGISTAEADLLLNNDIDSLLKQLSEHLPYFVQLDDARQRVLVNVAFNIGIAGLLQFREMLAAVEAHQYDEAATCLELSHLRAQATERTERLALLLRSPVVENA